MVRRTKENAEQTRNQILDAAERVFHERGVSNTTLDHVAKAAGVTRGAIYWHFENKSALFNAMHERISLPFMHIFEPLLESEHPLEDLQAVCVRGLKDIEDNAQLRRVFDVLIHRCEYVETMSGAAQRMNMWHETITNGVASVLRYAQSRGQLPSYIDADMTAFGLHSFMHGLISCRLSMVGSSSFHDNAEELVGRFFKGLRTN